MAGPTTTGLVAQLEGEPWHYVGSTDEPAFENDWESSSLSISPAFRLRAPGMIDVQAVMVGGSGSVFWTMPEGYRPTSPALLAGTAIGRTVSPKTYTPIEVYLNTDGTVQGYWPGGLTIAVDIAGSFFLVPPEVTP